MALRVSIPRVARNAPTTKKIETAKLPLVNHGRTQSRELMPSVGQMVQPCERTTSTMAMPRNPSKTETRRVEGVA